MSSRTVEVSYAAYSTLLLHCAKYPACEVMGFLLGSVSGSKVVVEKSIPVQHHWNRLSPMVEVAASLAQAHAASQSPSMQLVGIYHAPSDVASSTRSEISPSAAKVAQCLGGKLGAEAVVLQVNNGLLSSTTAHALHGFSVTPAGAKSMPPASVQLKESTSIEKVKKAIAKGAWSHLIDFDDHLEDTRLDWLEPTTAA